MELSPHEGGIKVLHGGQAGSSLRLTDRFLGVAAHKVPFPAAVLGVSVLFTQGRGLSLRALRGTESSAKNSFGINLGQSKQGISPCFVSNLF
jgi:hypothetical protein